MKNITKFDKSFNINKISSYQLTLKLSKTGYSYCIIDTIRRQYVAISYFNFEEKVNNNNFLKNLKKAIKEDAYLNKNYKAVNLICSCKKFTLIPDDFFDKRKLKTYFKFNQELLDKEEIHFNKIKSSNLYNVFVISSDITTYLVNQFPEIRFVHQGTPLINTYISKAKKSKSEKPTVILNISLDNFDLLAIKAGKLHHYNYYQYRTETDLIYYVLNTFKHLDLDVNKTEIIILGTVEGGTSMHKLLKEFFANVKFGTCNEDFTYNFAEVPEHLFSNILSIV